MPHTRNGNVGNDRDPLKGLFTPVKWVLIKITVPWGQNLSISPLGPLLSGKARYWNTWGTSYTRKIIGPGGPTLGRYLDQLVGPKSADQKNPTVISKGGQEP